MGELNAALIALGWAPYADWVAFAADLPRLISFLESLFAGRPKMLDTVQASARLAGSPWWPLRAFAANLGIWVRNGVPLSTSNSKYQAQLSGWKHGTDVSLMSLAPRQLTNIYALNSLLNLALTSEYGPRATTALNYVVSVAVRQSAVPPPPPPPKPPTVAESFCREQPHLCAAIRSLRAQHPEMAKDLDDLMTWLRNHPTVDWLGSLGLCLGTLITNQTAGVACLRKLYVEFIAYSAYQAAKKAVEDILGFFSSQPKQPPPPPPLRNKPPPSPGPGPLPTPKPLPLPKPPPAPPTGYLGLWHDPPGAGQVRTDIRFPARAITLAHPQSATAFAAVPQLGAFPRVPAHSCGCGTGDDGFEE